ncbi:polysaccharide biosynthesis protein [Candidatus Saccharibacteria bacterium]|nr:MAG: polysaccharide biosynthesis protein [Candidatus Saccharibacteria bacterium]
MLKDLKLEMKIMRYGEEQSEGSVASRIKDVSAEDLLGRGQIKLDQKEVASYLRGKVVMVTGAAGSIGSQLVREIFRFHPQKLCLVDINENDLYLLERELNFLCESDEQYKAIKVVAITASIREKETLDEIFAGCRPSVVFHAAAHKHVPLMEARPQEAIKNNIFGTRNLMDCAIKYGVKRFILISTDKAVNPTNVMGATKRVTELMMQAHGSKTGTKFAAVRFGNVLGSNGSVIPIFKAQIEKGGPVTLTHRDIERFFMTIPEAAQLVLQAGYYAADGDIFVLDMGKPVKILDLAENLIRLAGYEPYVDIDIIETGLRPGEKMFEELFLSSETHTKTKNNLIYRKRHQAVNQALLKSSLRKLWHVVETSAPPETMRLELFKAIKQTKRVTKKLKVQKP